MKSTPTRSQTVSIRPLTHEHRQQLCRLIDRDPVVSVFNAEHLVKFGLPDAQRATRMRSPFGFMGIFEAPNDAAAPAENSALALGAAIPRALRQMAQVFARPLPFSPESVVNTQDAPADSIAPVEEKLVGAFWLGGNCVPVDIPEQYIADVAAFISQHHRQIASIFGAADTVLPLWEKAEPAFKNVLDIRAQQPLLYLPPQRSISHSRDLYRPGLPAPQISKGVRFARESDNKTLLQASVAMFTEEVGYDPMTRDSIGYKRRVHDFIAERRTVVAVNAEDVVVFKTDVGIAAGDVCQLQGVWLHPAYRGFGLSAPLLVQACELLRPRYPHISLYVNDYNVRARALYARVGFEQADTFATVLF